MVVAGHVKLLALDLACQRLARRARAMASISAALDVTKADEVDRLVGLALAALGEESWKSASPADSKKKPSAGLLMRMLRGKDESVPAPARVEDAAPSPKHKLALRGESDCVPPPDLLGFLSAQRKTGTLEVVTPTDVFTLEFDAGDVVHAHVNPTIPQQRLGDILVASGAIDRDAIEQLRKEGLSQRLGEMLLRKNLVTHEQLIAALETQVQLLFNRMFAAPVSRFTFWNGPPILADQGMRLNAMALILEGARTHDETLIVDPRDYPATLAPDWIALAAAAAARETPAEEPAASSSSDADAPTVDFLEDPAPEPESLVADAGDDLATEEADAVEAASIVDSGDGEPDSKLDTVEDPAS
jgi:hypothetical protein